MKQTVGKILLLQENGNDRLALEDGQFVVTVGTDNYYLQYRVKIGAYNDNGHGPNSTEHVIFSAEGSKTSLHLVNLLIGQALTKIIYFILFIVRDTFANSPMFIFSF